MGTRLLDALNCKSMGLPYDEQFYFDRIMGIMRNAYKARYPYTRIPGISDNEYMDTEQASFFTQKGNPVVEYETFISWCLEKLVSKKLEQKAYMKGFSDDDQLGGYFFKAFENMLIEETGKLTPGFTSRIKQIDLVLRETCRKDTVNGKKCVRLKNIKETADHEPATMDKIMEVSKDINPPELIYPKKRDASNNPSISKDEMSRYLSRVISACGGLVCRNDIIKLIKTVYGYASPVNVNASSGYMRDEETSQAHQEYYECHDVGGGKESDGCCIGQEHYFMAKQVYAGMDSQMKEVYCRRRVDGLTTRQAAEMLSCSNGKLNNIEKKIDSHIARYFGPEKETSPQEIESVITLLNHLFLQEREN